jgi:asparagine synthase (glutamine-hydrolysing)
VDAPGANLAADVSRMLWQYDEPVADSSAVPSFALARAIGDGFKVVLNGDGGDEVFGGYNHYTRIATKQALKAAAAAAGLCDGRGTGSTGIYVQSKSLFRAGERARLLDGHSVGNACDGLVAGWAYPAPSVGPLKRAMWTDRHLHLANGLTYKVDIALAAFGREGRAPFLDHELMEWAQALPADELVAGAEKKVLLREAYAQFLPAGILHRSKHGFGGPVERWLDGPLQELFADSVPGPWFHRQAQLSLAEGAGPGETSGQKKWTLMMLNAWARTWKATW